MSEEERPNESDRTKKTPRKPRRAGRMLRRLLTAVLALALLPVLLFASACLLSRTEWGERWIIAGLNPVLHTALAPTGLSLHLEGLHSELPFAASVSGIELSDARGVWFRAERLSLALNWRALSARRIEVSDLSLEHPALMRLPEILPSSSPEPETAPQAALTPYNLFQLFPAWLADLKPEFEIKRLAVDGLDLAPAIAGEAMTLDLNASAFLSPVEVALDAAVDVALDAALAHKSPGPTSGRNAEQDSGGDTGPDMRADETLTLALKLNSDAVLDLRLAADEGPSGLAARLLPAELAARPRMRFELRGTAPLALWKGELRFVLADLDASATADAEDTTPGTDPVPAPAGTSDLAPEPESDSALHLARIGGNIPTSRHVATLAGDISLALPPEGETADNPWLPRDIGLELTAKSGPAADGLKRLIGLSQGAASVEISALTTLDQRESGLALGTEAKLSAHAGNTRWEDARLAALLGNALGATFTLKAAYAPEELRLGLSSLSFEAGMLSAEGRAAFSLPRDGSPASDAASASGREDAGALIPAAIAQALIDVELHAVARPNEALIATLAPEARERLKLDGSARLDATLSGTPASPRARVDLACPGLAVDGEKLRDIFLHAKLDNLKDYASDISLTGSLDTGLVLRGENISLKADWSARHERAGALAAALRDAALRAGGMRADGDLAIVMDAGKAPRLDGALLAEVRDWNLLSCLVGRRLSGSEARFELALKHEGEIQLASLKGGAGSFALGAASQSQGEDLAVAGLRVSLDARDIWNTASLDAGVTVSGLEAGGIALKDIESKVTGALSGPLTLTASTEGGIKTRIDAAWSPGKIDLRELSVEPGPARNAGRRARRASRAPQSPPPGIVLLSPGTLAYSESSFSTPGLDFKLLPEGTLTLRGSYDPAKLNLDMDLKGLQFAPLRMFVKALPDGNVNAALALRGSLDRPAGALRAEVREVRFPGSELAPLACDLNAEVKHPGGQSVLEAKLEVPITSLVLLGARQGWASVRLPLENTGTGLVPSLSRNMAASLRWDGVVSPLWAYLPIADRRMTGGIHLAADIGGSLAQPKIDADVELSNAAFEDLALGVLLRNINAKARFTDEGKSAKKDAARRASVTLSGGDGLGGTLKLDGSVDLASRTMQATLNLDKLKPLRRQDLRISLSGDGGVMGTLEAPFVNANITVNEGEFSLAHLPSGGIRELPISSGEESEPNPPKGVLSVRIDVPRRFFVRGRGLESEWKGRLHIGGPLNAPGILGSIDVVRGDFELLNRDFTFSKGSIQFAGSQKIDPRLDIVMTYTAPAIVAEAIVGGSASRPSFRLASQPSLPQDEIISQIMFGKYAQSLGKFEAIQLAGGVAALAGIGNGGLGVLSSTREALGVDMLRLNSATSSDSDESGEDDLAGTTLEMGKYITDKIYVGVEQGMAADSTGALVEIELTPEISLEAKTNSERTEAAVQWQHNY